MLLYPPKDTSEPDEASEEPDISEIAEPDSETSETEPEKEPVAAADTVLEELLTRRETLMNAYEDVTETEKEIEDYLSEKTGYQKIGTDYYSFALFRRKWEKARN